jgi:hypothetical protein
MNCFVEIATLVQLQVTHYRPEREREKAYSHTPSSLAFQTALANVLNCLDLWI